MSKQLLELYSHFPEYAATKGAADFSIYNWTEEGTAVQREIISKFKNLRTLEIIFSFPSIIDGVPIDKFNYSLEQTLWWDTSLHYYPQHDRSVEEEKAVLAKDLEAFIGRYGLNRILEMPKLKGMQFRFYANSGGENAVDGGNE
jgi:hypothetical protein